MTRFANISIVLLFLSVTFLFPAIASAATQYLLGPEDVISITVLNQPIISGIYAIAPDGTIRVPIAGAIIAAGLNLPELEAKLTEALRTRYVKPEVTVSLRTPRLIRIYVFGAVKFPGAFDLDDTRSIIGAIAAAGGLTQQTDQCRANLFRASSNKTFPVDLIAALTKADPQANILMEAGDVLNIELINKIPIYLTGSGINDGFYLVSEGTSVRQAISIGGGLKGKATESTVGISRGASFLPVKLTESTPGDDPPDRILLAGDTIKVESTLMTIYVSGEVNKPGIYSLPREKGLVEAIALAGGLTPLAATGNITISTGETVIPSIDYITMAETGKNLLLRNGDRVFVPTSNARIAVLGMVTSPGNYTFDERRPLTAVDAIALAKGVLPRAASTHVSVIRMVDGVPKRIPVDLKAIFKSLDLRTNIALLPDDIVYVPETSKINWDKMLSTMLSLGVLRSAISR